MRVDSVTSREVLTHDDLAKIRAAGTNVDTIIATPDTVVIHVGSTTPPADLVQVRALDAAGQPIAHFVQSIIYPRSDQYDFRGGNFLAVAPGQTIFYIEALPRYPSEPRTRPSTAVVLKVVP